MILSLELTPSEKGDNSCKYKNYYLKPALRPCFFINKRPKTITYQSLFFILQTNCFIERPQ